MESNKVLTRSEVPIEQTWNLEKIFPSVEAWEEALNSIDDQISKISVYKNKLTESPQQLVDCLTKSEAVSRKVERIYLC